MSFAQHKAKDIMFVLFLFGTSSPVNVEYLQLAFRSLKMRILNNLVHKILYGSKQTIGKFKCKLTSAFLFVCCHIDQWSY